MDGRDLNKINFNATKCSFLKFKGDLGFDPTLCGNKINLTKSATDLGLILSSDLKWSENIQNRIKKTRRIFQMIRRNSSNSLTIFSKKQLYKSIFMPTLLYSSECYWPSRTDIAKLEALNKDLTKWILPWLTYKQRLAELDLLPIPYFMEMKEMVILSSIVTGKYDIDFENLYSFRICGRRGLLFDLPRITKENQRYNFWYRCPYRYNRLHGKLSIFDSEGIKAKLLSIMWEKFRRSYNELDLCTSSFICICENCRNSNRVV